MATTITITIPGNTIVVLPDSETLEKLVDASLTISVDNQSGQSILLESSGSATCFTLDDLPSSIADDTEDDVVLSVVSSGSVQFAFDEDLETIVVEVQSLEVTKNLTTLFVG